MLSNESALSASWEAVHFRLVLSIYCIGDPGDPPSNTHGSPLAGRRVEFLLNPPEFHSIVLTEYVQSNSINGSSRLNSILVLG